MSIPKALLLVEVCFYDLFFSKGFRKGLLHLRLSLCS